jgi:hypothetical protein
MPEAVFKHAIAGVNETTSFITGGSTSANNFSPNTWFFNHVSQEFQAGPSLIAGRSSHASAKIQDKVTKENIVAVVGGNVGGYWQDSTELLINGESEWQQGKNHVK